LRDRPRRYLLVSVGTILRTDITCRGMTPGGLRAQYLIPNLSPKRECLSIHSSLLLGPCHHAILRNQRKQSHCRTEANCRPQVPLSNPFEETFLLWMGFFTKLGPRIRLPPVPNFGVNTCLHITQAVSGWQLSLGTLAHLVFLFSLPICLRIFRTILRASW
jgi:hypothetical protein